MGIAAAFARYLQMMLIMFDATDTVFVSLTAQLVTSFRSALTEDLDIATPPETMRLAGDICRMAKAKGMPPEALLVHLKTAWDDAGLKRGYPHRKDWYDQLVMHCLEEYYKPVPE
jgi:hypothetical protein